MGELPDGREFLFGLLARRPVGLLPVNAGCGSCEPGRSEPVPARMWPPTRRFDMAIATPRNFGKIWLSTLARTGREGRSLSSGALRVLPRAALLPVSQIGRASCRER